MKKILAYIVVLLVSAQTFAAVADVHQSHQSGSEHVEFNHEHDIADENIEANTKANSKPSNLQLPVNSPTNSFDCHHCCHCHGGHFNFLTLNKSQHTPVIQAGQPVGYTGPAQNGIQTNPYRPPKA